MGERGIVYILENPCIVDPDTKKPLYKIGRTQNLPQRLSDLYGTGVPCPFDCVFACEVNDYKPVETELQKLFGDYRINPDREFFSINPTQLENIISILKRFDGFRDATEKVRETVEEENLKSDTLFQETDSVPDGYSTYANLKHLLDIPEDFGRSYFCLRVATMHKKQGVPVYKSSGKGYYRKDIFLEKAKSENILRNTPDSVNA
jgi:hypothetical protein